MTHWSHDTLIIIIIIIIITITIIINIYEVKGV